MFLMLPSYLASALVLCSVTAFSLPQQRFSNTTEVSSSGAAVTGCANQCFRNAQTVATIHWSQVEVTATVTAETLLLVVNNRTNITRTSTIINTKIDPNEYAPATTNSAGTVTTSVTLQDGSTNSTQYIAYPTTKYEDFPSTYSLCGTLNTTISGSATCLTYQDGCDVYDGTTTINHQAPTFTYPSHSLPSESNDPNLDLVRDPKGWTYSALIEYGYSGDTLASVQFPDLGVWACTRTEVLRPAVAHGPQTLSTALVLTATSTSTEANVPNPSSARAVTQDPVAAVAVSTGQASNLPPPPLPTQVTPSLVHGTEATLVSEHGSQPSTAAENTSPSAKTESAMAGFVNTLDRAEISKLAVPVQISVTDGQGRVIGASILSTLSGSAVAPLLVPISATNIDAQHNAIVLTNLAANSPVPLSSTNERGGVTVPPSLAIAAVTASTPVVLTSTDAQGRIITSTSYLPAVLLTTSDAQGSQLITTSPILPAVDITNTNTQRSPVLSTPEFPPANAAPPTLTIGSQTVTANSQNQYIIGSQTLTPGGRIIVSGTTISASPGATGVISGTSTEKLTSGPIPDITSPPAIMIGSQTITADSLGRYVFGSQTLTPGIITTIAGTKISLAPGLTPGGRITVSGTTILLLPGGTGLLLGTSTEESISGLLPGIIPPSAITIGSQTIIADSLGRYVFGSQTLTPGGVATIAGTRISLAPGGDEALVGSSTEGLGAEIMSGLRVKEGYGSASVPSVTSPPTITIGTQTITADVSGQYVFGSQTLTPGGVITIAGTKISLAPGGNEALVGSSTEGLGPAIIGGLGGKEGYGIASVPSITSSPAITIGSQTITADSSGHYVFGNQTLTPGGIVTIAGTRISLAPGGTEALVGSSTEGLGPYIMGGLGGKEGYENASAVLTFRGAATQCRRSMWGGSSLALMGLAVVILL